MVSPLSSLLRFAVGNALGVIALLALIVVSHQGDVQSGLWIAMMWVPVSCFYSAVVIGVSRRLIRLQSPLLMSLLGFIVALLPFVSGFWPLYWWLPQYMAIFVAIHLTLLAAAASGVAIDCPLFHAHHLTRRWS